MKKILWPVIILTLFLLMALPCTAQDTPRISGLSETFWKDQHSLSFTVKSDGQDYTPNMSSLLLNPGDEITLDLPPIAFADTFGATLDKSSAVLSAAAIQESGIRPRIRIDSGAQAFGDMQLKDVFGGVCLSIQLTADFLFTREMDFDYLVFLPYDAGSGSAAEIRIAGKVANPVVEVYAEDESVDLSGGRVAHAMEYVKSINVGLGNGVTIKTSFFEDSRYYGTCAVEFSSEDNPVLSDYPEVMYALTLHTIGLKRAGRESVGINLGNEFYAYNADGEYAGTTDKLLHFSSRYYLTDKRLERIDIAETDLR